jgi:hypothetical protein
LFQRGQADGVIRDDVPAAWLAESLIGLAETVVLSRHPLGLEDSVAAIASLFMDGARAH